MVIKTAEFIKSSGKWQDCPDPVLPEYAFIGRSNVGKSSLINAMLNHKDLAKTSILFFYFLQPAVKDFVKLIRLFHHGGVSAFFDPVKVRIR